MRINPLHNIGLKVSAVALAMLLWVHVETNKIYEYQVELPLKVVGIRKGLVLSSEIPSHVTLRVRATGKQLLLLETTQRDFVIDASEFKAGSHEKIISGPEAIAVLGRRYDQIDILSPKTLNIILDPEGQRMLPVISKVEAKAAPGFATVLPIQIEPESVLVTGPTATLPRLRAIETAPTLFVEISSPTSSEVALQLPESLHLSVADSTVKVLIQVEATTEKTFFNVPVTPPRNLSAGLYAIVPPQLTLRLGIPKSEVESVDNSDIVISFKKPSRLRDTMRAALEIQLPPRVRIVGSPPDSILLIRRS